MNKVFLSWSGERSYYLARIFGDFLKQVIQTADIWISGEDIEKGRSWSNELIEGLEQCSMGVCFLTPENISKPWLLFEAGAIFSKDRKIMTALYQLDPTHVPTPLSLFQSTLVTEKDEMRKLVSSINSSLGAAAVDKDRIKTSFGAGWTKFYKKLEKTPSSPDFNAVVFTYDENGQCDIIDFSMSESSNSLEKNLTMLLYTQKTKFGQNQQKVPGIEHEYKKYRILNLRKKVWLAPNYPENLANYLARHSCDKVAFVHSDYIEKMRADFKDDKATAFFIHMLSRQNWSKNPIPQANF